MSKGLIWPTDYPEKTRQWIFDHRAEGHCISGTERFHKVDLRCVCGATHQAARL